MPPSLIPRTFPGGPPLARGRTADVFPWEGGQVLKLFHAWVDPASVEFEAELGRRIHRLGIPVPAVGEILTFEGRRGLTYQRLDGPSMKEQMERAPWHLFGMARRLARLQAEMHSQVRCEGLPQQRDRLRHKIRSAEPLSSATQKTILTALDALPDGDRLCHGDFHPGNILLTPGGDFTIDWIDATAGNPLADVARSSVICLGAAASRTVPNPILRLLVRLFHHIYLAEYFTRRTGGRQEYSAWLPVVAAARLSEGIPHEAAWLDRQARRCHPSPPDSPASGNVIQTHSRGTRQGRDPDPLPVGPRPGRTSIGP